MNKYIPIVFAADDGYAMPTAVAITSLLANKNKSSVYKIYIIAPSLSNENIEKLKSLETNTCHIEIIFAADLLADKVATLPKVSSTDYYRLMLDTLLPNEDKVIALDGDLLVLEDLTSLWNVDLEGNYLAGCYFRPHDVYNRKYVQDVLGLDEGKRINIGVMLMDLKKIKKDNLQEKFVSKIGVFRTMSEDIINFVCKDKIKYIPIKYNFNLHFYKFRDLLEGDPHYTMKEYDKADKHPAIFHYTLEKPWKAKTKRDKEWLRYFYKSPYSFSKLQRKCSPSFSERLFSIGFKEKNDKIYAIVRILGMKFKLRAKYL